MKERIVILGAGGHGRVVADVARLCGYREIVFLDDSQNCLLPISGGTNEYPRYIGNSDFFVAIGNNAIRKRLMDELMQHDADIATIIHPSAVIGSRVEIGMGTVVMAGVVINCDTRIGAGVIINTCSSVDHDCTVEDYCHISVGSRLVGAVTVGANTFIGTGSVVINNISICADSVIGAGAVVIRDILVPDTYVGVPAKKITRG